MGSPLGVDQKAQHTISNTLTTELHLAPSNTWESTGKAIEAPL